MDAAAYMALRTINATIMESQRLAQLAQCKLQIMQLLRRLAAQQLEDITGGDMSNLLKLLAAKQTVMDQLAKLEQQLDPFRGQDPETPRLAVHRRPRRVPAECGKPATSC